MSNRRSTPARRCHLCDEPISAARLEILPDTTICLACAKRHPDRKVTAQDVELSQSSPIDRTGFAPTD